MVEDYYEHNEEEYKNYMKRYPPGQNQNASVSRVLMKKFGELEFESVFDVGCGYGLIIKALLDKFEGKSCICMDLSDEQVESAKKYLDEYYKNDLTILQGDIIHYRSGQKYDLVFCTTVLSHIPEQYIDDAVANTCALSKQHIAIVEPTIDVIARLNRPDDQWLYDYQTMFKDRGWKMVEVVQINGYPIQYMRFKKVK